MNAPENLVGVGISNVTTKSYFFFSFPFKGFASNKLFGSFNSAKSLSKTLDCSFAVGVFNAFNTCKFFSNVWIFSGL